jgi:hypothetical protein
MDVERGLLGEKLVIGAIRRMWDNFRGSGAAAVTVPPMDGALRPNRLLEDAEAALDIRMPDDLAYDGKGVVVSSGAELRRLHASGSEPFAVLDADVTALAATPSGRIAAATVAGGIVVIDREGHRSTIARLGDGAAECVTAMAFASDDELIVAQGSTDRPIGQWKRDLMERSANGAVSRTSIDGARQTRLVSGLGWPLGIVIAPDGRIVVSESWRHRLVALGGGRGPEPLLSDLPGYPARIHRDPAGGYWLALFAPRNQIIEFVQREPAFLAKMFEEVEDPYWVAPSLHSSSTFLEPLQGGAQKHLGMLKPWAPTRSYGLVVRLDASFRPVTSYHSRADGKRHGVFTCLPDGDRVLVASKGGDVVVAIRPEGAPKSGAA